MENGCRRGKDKNMSETIARLLMVLIGFVVAMLGVIYAMLTDDLYLGILIATGGVTSMYVGLPQ